MSKTVLCVLLFSGCATGSVGTDREMSPHTGARLDLAAATVRPAAQPELPSVDWMSSRVKERLGADPSVKVDLCVEADGHVGSIALVRGTSMEMFDQAVLRDAASWKFEPADARTCTKATIVYRPS